MVLTDEFRKIFRRNTREFNIEKALEVSLEEADDLGVIPFRSRRKRNTSFNKQEGNF